MSLRRAAVWRLVLATAAWGMSFPTAKSVMAAQALHLPGRPEWFYAALVLAHRMLLAAALMGVWYARRLMGISRVELWQGVQLGLWGGVGMLLQTDAQMRIPASTSAFFTQFTSVFVPAWVAFAARKKPTWRVACASLLVVVGCAILSGVNLSGLGFGLGEWETIFAAALFTGQILCLERPGFQSNDMRRVAVVMFSVKALLMLPLVFMHEPLSAFASAGWAALYGAPSMWVMLGFLTVFSTVYGYGTMTQWQPHVSSVQAGLIYATEPVFATVWALFLPGWFSSLAGIQYENEVLGGAFFLGAFAILLANVLAATQPQQHAPASGA